jgi:hypothetical protein
MAPNPAPLSGGDRKPQERAFAVAAELEKRVLRLHKDGMGQLKIGKTLGVGTALVQGIVRPFEASAA